MPGPTHFFNTIKIGGIGCPVVDVIPPTQDDLKKGKAVLVALEDKLKLRGFGGVDNNLDYNTVRLLSNVLRDGPDEIARGQKALRELKTFFDKRQYSAGKRYDLTEQESEFVEQHMRPVLIAARTINFAADFLKEPRPFKIRYLGGSLMNKLSGMAAMFADSSHISMLGNIGHDSMVNDPDAFKSNRNFIEQEIKKSGIGFTELDTSSNHHIALNYILPNGAKLRSRSTFSQSPSQYYDKIDAFLGQFNEKKASSLLPENFIFIEGGDGNDRKLRKSGFKHVVDSVCKLNTNVALALPSDTLRIVGNTALAKKSRGDLFKLIKHENFSVLFGDETELVALFCKENFKRRSGEKLAENPTIIKAICNLQKCFREKINKHQLGRSNIEPIAFITLGKEGALAITATQCLMVPSSLRPDEIAAHAAEHKHDQMVSIAQCGAGDAFAAGSFLEYLFLAYSKLKKQKSNEGTNSQRPITFDENDLDRIVTRGHQMGAAAAGVQGAQPPKEIFEMLMLGKPPPSGNFVHFQMPAPHKTKSVSRC